MARYSQRPENALKRANEFIEVGKPARALDTLYEVFKNKKWAYNWSESVLEPIMFKYLELCVELKKSHIAKEGLFQYRNMFQSVNVGSLENVIRGYLRSAEERTESAREQSTQAVIDIDDLDNLATPESILLSAVSGEDAQDRSDRTILTPWVKFLWESYCQCLELLRTNAHVETLYHDIAKMAFNFCLKYNRKTEFRKLCDKLRKHLEDIAKLPTQTVNVSLSKPETQQYNLETRLVQLDSAIQMELWQEAYKATEDIHNLMMMSKKSSVPKTMSNYYQKLAMVFWKAGYYLFHAAALFKLFQLNKEMKKNITQEELTRMASLVLLATLSVPLPSAHPEFDRFIETDKSPLEKAQKLSVLLGLTSPPTRQSLLKEIVRLNILNLAAPQYQQLYNCLEIEFNPLELCVKVDEVVASIEDQQYVQPLRDVTLVKLILQISQVYQTITFDRLIELTNKFSTPFHMERILVECVRHNDMQIRIDHGAGCIHFGIDLSESQREDKQDGPLLQSMPSEQIRNQLINMSSVLTKSMQLINPTLDKKQRDSTHARLILLYHTHKQQEHQRILARHKIIEDRKEYIEKMNTEREEEEARRHEEAIRHQMIIEHERIENEKKEREKRRLENELALMKQRNLKEKVQQISQTSHGQKILRKLDEEEMKNLDAEQITAKELEELQKERKELQQKLKSQEKKMDYFERAKRQEEIPLLEKAFLDKKVSDRTYWEEKETKRIATLISDRELAVAHRERLKRMKEDKEYFMSKLLKERLSTFESKLENFEKRLVDERKKRLLKRKQDRKRNRHDAFIAQKEAEERKKREEEEEKRMEEIRKKNEEENKRRLEREESLKKLNESKPEPYRPIIIREDAPPSRSDMSARPTITKDTPPPSRGTLPPAGAPAATGASLAGPTKNVTFTSNKDGDDSSSTPAPASTGVYVPRAAAAAAAGGSAPSTGAYVPPVFNRGGTGSGPPPSKTEESSSAPKYQAARGGSSYSREGGSSYSRDNTGDRDRFSSRDGDRSFSSRDGDRSFSSRDGDRSYSSRDGDRSYSSRDGGSSFSREGGSSFSRDNAGGSSFSRDRQYPSSRGAGGGKDRPRYGNQEDGGERNFSDRSGQSSQNRSGGGGSSEGSWRNTGGNSGGSGSSDNWRS